MGWRSDVRTNGTTTLEAFQSANPTLLDRVHSARPSTVGDTRSAWMGAIGENIRHDSGTWQRIADVEIVVARHLADNEETADDVEELADALIEWLSADDRTRAFGAYTLQEPVRSVTAEIAEGGVFTPAVIITCRATIQQGRN